MTSSKMAASFAGLSETDRLKLDALVDENEMKCLKCNKIYGSISNLHRHAVRHLGWRRFKCGFCVYSSYNRCAVAMLAHLNNLCVTPLGQRLRAICDGFIMGESRHRMFLCLFWIWSLRIRTRSTQRLTIPGTAAPNVSLSARVLLLRVFLYFEIC